MNEKNKVLLIEDEQILAKLIQKQLSKRGLDVDILTDAVRYREKITDNKYDLILLDWVMPEISGIEILKDIRKNIGKLELPIIMVTSNSETNEVVEALNEGANDYITKPVNIEIAMARINSQIALKELNSVDKKQERLEALNSMIVTYHHEIKNPLSIALSYLQLPKEKFSDERRKNTLRSLERITEILDKMQTIEDLHYDQYGQEIKIVKLS